MSKRYQTYPAAPTAMISAVSYAALLPNISEMVLCKDNSVVIELYTGGDSPPLTDETVTDLQEYFEVPPGHVVVEPGEDGEHLFIEVWATRFDFSDYFPEEIRQDGVDPDFVSEHVVLVEGEPFSVLVHYDYFFARFVAEVIGIPGGDIIIAAADLESALSYAAEEIDARLESDAQRISELSATLFECDDEDESWLDNLNEEE